MKKFFKTKKSTKNINKPEPKKIPFSFELQYKSSCQKSNILKKPENYIFQNSPTSFKKITPEAPTPQKREFKFPTNLLNFYNPQIKKSYIWQLDSTGIIYTTKNFDSNLKFFTILQKNFSPFEGKKSLTVQAYNEFIESIDHNLAHQKKIKNYRVFEILNLLVISYDLDNNRKILNFYDSKNKKLLRKITLVFLRDLNNRLIPNRIMEKINKVRLFSEGELEVFEESHFSKSFFRYTNSIFFGKSKVKIEILEVNLSTLDISEESLMVKYGIAYQVHILSNSDFFVIYGKRDGKKYKKDDAEFTLFRFGEVIQICDELEIQACYQQKFEKKFESYFFVCEYWKRRIKIFKIDELKGKFQIVFLGKYGNFFMTKFSLKTLSMHISYNHGCILIERRKKDNKNKIIFLKLKV